MSDLLSRFVFGDAMERGRRRGGRVGLLAGLVEAGEILLGHVAQRPVWRGTDAVGLVIADERRGVGVPVVMGLADRPSGSVLATILDLRPGEGVLAPGRWSAGGPAAVAGVFVAAEVSSARSEAARVTGVAVGLGDDSLDRSREAAFRLAASRDVGPALAAEREMLSLFRADREHGMPSGEAFLCSVAEYGSSHPQERRHVLLLAARLLRADVGLSASAPEMSSLERGLREKAPPARSVARAREDDGWERKPYR